MDLDTSAVVTVTVKIGSNAFSFPTSTFTASTIADYRVCDVKVEANGTVTILPANTSITTLAPPLNAQKLRM
jgi:hypothetical protein